MYHDRKAIPRDKEAIRPNVGADCRPHRRAWRVDSDCVSLGLHGPERGADSAWPSGRNQGQDLHGAPRWLTDFCARFPDPVVFSGAWLVCVGFAWVAVNALFAWRAGR